MLGCIQLKLENLEISKLENEVRAKASESSQLGMWGQGNERMMEMPIILIIPKMPIIPF